jgi:hypothetical protein
VTRLRSIRPLFTPAARGAAAACCDAGLNRTLIHSDEAGRLFQVKSAMHSNLIAATLPNSSRPGSFVSSGRVGFGDVILRSGWSSCSPWLAQTFTFQFDALGAVNDAIEDSFGQSGITDHLMMPQTSTGESLTFGSLILGVPFMGAVSRSAIAAPAAARPSLWFGFRMGGSDQSPDRRRIGEAVQRTCRPWRSGRCTFLCGRFCR